jgi:hypothetical protein
MERERDVPQRGHRCDDSRREGRAASKRGRRDGQRPSRFVGHALRAPAKERRNKGESTNEAGSSKLWRRAGSLAPPARRCVRCALE